MSVQILDALECFLLGGGAAEVVQCPQDSCSEGLLTSCSHALTLASVRGRRNGFGRWRARHGCEHDQGSVRWLARAGLRPPQGVQPGRPAGCPQSGAGTEPSAGGFLRGRVPACSWSSPLFAAMYFGVRPAEAVGLAEPDLHLPEEGRGSALLHRPRQSVGKQWTGSGRPVTTAGAGAVDVAHRLCRPDRGGRACRHQRGGPADPLREVPRRTTGRRQPAYRGSAARVRLNSLYVPKPLELSRGLTVIRRAR